MKKFITLFLSIFVLVQLSGCAIFEEGEDISISESELSEEEQKQIEYDSFDEEGEYEEETETFKIM